MRILVFDIGGMFIKYALMEGDINVRQWQKLETPQEDRGLLIDALVRIYEEAEGVEGIAVSMPGIIDPDKGYCKMGGALRYNDDFYFRDALAAKCNLPIHIENNAKCAAMAEAKNGSLKDVTDGMALFFDKMIGGALIRDRRLVRGSHFAAGEVAYIVTVRNDMPEFDTVWGNRCGMPRLCKMYARAKRKDEKQITLTEVFSAIDAGDEDASACLDAFSREVAVQVFNIQTILDVERFAIGGAASEYPAFIEMLRANLRDMYAVSPYDVPQAEIVAGKFGEDASLIGAMECFMEWLKETE